MSSGGRNSCRRCRPRHGSGAGSLNYTPALIVEGPRPYHHAYAASLPWYMLLKDYQGDIRIHEGPNGSRIVWTVTCVSRILPKKSVKSRLEGSYARLAAALAHEAELASRTE